MTRYLRRLLPSPAMVVALIALFVALGGVSYGVVTGYIDSREIKNNTIRSKDVRNGTLQSKDVGRDVLGGGAVKESTLGTVPSAGTAFGGARFAVVNAGGQAVRGRDVSSAARTGDGRYQVIFNGDVRGCAYFATIGDPSAAGPPQNSQVSVGSLASNVNGVSIRTENGAGAEQNRPFHLIVMC
jgi:hypothetical protein